MQTGRVQEGEELTMMVKGGELELHVRKQASKPQINQIKGTLEDRNKWLAGDDAVKKHYRTHDNDLLELIAFDIERLPPAQGKPFNLPEIYIADGYDTIEGEDGNVGFGVYVPDENQIYVAGDVEGEIRARALLHEICHWVQAMCGRPFDEDEANEFSDIIYDALPSAQPEEDCDTCKHGYFGDTCCNNCKVRFPSHYERRTDE